MAGFTSLQNIKDVVALSGGTFVVDYKKNGTAAVIGTTLDLWSVAGSMTLGVDPTAGMAGAVATSKTSAGASYFPDAPAGEDYYLWKAAVTRTAGTSFTSQGALFLAYDRLAHANVSIVQATASFSPVINGTSRLATGEGAQILCIVTGALSAAANVFNLTYTNQAGAGSKTTQNVTTVASAVVLRTPYASYTWVPLADGDTGVRSIEGWTLVSGTATGNINIILVKPLSYITQLLYYTEPELDYAVMLSGMQKIHNSACLCMAQTGSISTTASAFQNTITLIHK